MVLVFFKGAVSNALANTEPSLLGGMELGSCELYAHNPFINLSTHKLALCVFLSKDHLLRLFCWLTDTELAANSKAAHA